MRGSKRSRRFPHFPSPQRAYVNVLIVFHNFSNLYIPPTDSDSSLIVEAMAAEWEVGLFGRIYVVGHDWVGVCVCVWVLHIYVGCRFALCAFFVRQLNENLVFYCAINSELNCIIVCIREWAITQSANCLLYQLETRTALDSVLLMEWSNLIVSFTRIQTKGTKSLTF